MEPNAEVEVERGAENENENEVQTIDIKEIDRLLLDAQSTKKLEGISEDTLEELLEQMNTLRTNFEKSGHFFEADQAKQRVTKLKDAMSRKKLLSLTERHNSEKAKLEEEFQNEINMFNEFWQQKIDNYDNESAKLEQQLVERQNDGFQKYVLSLEETVSKNPKASSDLLNSKAMISQLAKSQEYKEAYVLQQKCVKIEQSDREKFEMDRDQKIKNLAQSFKQKQATELKALQMKILSGHEELEKAKAVEFNRLSNKFTSARRNLENSQLQEYNKFEKSLKGSVSGSVMLNKSQYSTFMRTGAMKSSVTTKKA